jgi:hypothetical protein
MKRPRESSPLPAVRDFGLDGLALYIYSITAAGNAIISQLSSSSQGGRYGPPIAIKITPASPLFPSYARQDAV